MRVSWGIFSELNSKIFKRAGVFSQKVEPWDFDPSKSFEKDEFWKIFSSCLDKMNEPLEHIHA